LPVRNPSIRAQPGPPASDSAAGSWFAGRSVGVILLILGALCVLAAAAVFTAVAWTLLPLAVRILILVVITASFGLLAHLALLRGLQATAEAMAVTAAGMLVLNLVAARRADLFGLDGLSTVQYQLLAGTVLATVAGAGALALRRRKRWLWSLDAAVACGLAGGAWGALTVDIERYPGSPVTVTVLISLLYLLCRHLRLPLARWTTVALGALAWGEAVAVGTGRAADQVGGDPARVGAAWPALVVAIVAGLWSLRQKHPVWRRVAAGLCLLPVLLLFEIVAWSHGWVVGTLVVLVGFVVAALLSGQVPAAWSPAVGGSALVLALSSVLGLLPIAAALTARLGLAVLGRWQGPDTAPPALPAGLQLVDLQPWLLPLVTVVPLLLLPKVTIDGYQPSFDRRHAAGASVASLGVLPVVSGAGFWVSIAVLVTVATVLILAARWWRDDLLLCLGLLLLAILRLCAYYDDLADPLAWTIIAAAGVGWSVGEQRQLVRAGFRAAAGVSALFAAAQWLTLVNAPRPFQGLVIVLIGSLGLVTSQRLPLRALNRLVGEGISVTWVVAGLAMAESSPSRRAAELTVAGVAVAIVGLLSQDRRRAGWVSGVLLTVASWIRLVDVGVQVVEWYTLPAAAALLVYGLRRLRRDRESNEPTQSSLRCLGPGLALAQTPSLLLVAREPVSWRGLVVALASVALLSLGVRARLAAPFVFGGVATGLLAMRNIWPVTAFLPRWAVLFMVGGALLGTGMTWESRVRDVRTAGRYVRGLR